MMKFQLVLRCKNWRCDHHRKPFKRTVHAESQEDLKSISDPPCPKCSKKPKLLDTQQMPMSPIPLTPMEEWLEQGKSPSLTGRNNSIKAVDMAATIAMEDYGLTNLKDRVGPGESMAPSLPPTQQKMADNFFSPGTNPAFNKKRQAQATRLGQRAMAGAFRSTALDVKSVLPDSRVALRSVRSEQIKH